MNPFTFLWSFYGRIGRFSYVAGFLLNLLLASALTFALFLLRRELGEPPPEDRWVYAVVLGFVVLLLFWAHLALAAKRFHDIGRSGWLSLLLLVPFLNVVVLLYLIFARGEE